MHLLIPVISFAAIAAALPHTELTQRDCIPYVQPNPSMQPTYIQICDDFCKVKTGDNCNSNKVQVCCYNGAYTASCRRQDGNVFGPGHWVIESCEPGVTCTRWENEQNGDIISACGGPWPKWNVCFSTGDVNVYLAQTINCKIVILQLWSMNSM